MQTQKDKKEGKMLCLQKCKKKQIKSNTDTQKKKKKANSTSPADIQGFFNQTSKKEPKSSQAHKCNI